VAAGRHLDRGVDADQSAERLHCPAVRGGRDLDLLARVLVGGQDTGTWRSARFEVGDDCGVHLPDVALAVTGARLEVTPASSRARSVSPPGLYNPIMPSWPTPRLASVAWGLAAFGVIAGSLWLTRGHQTYHSVLLAAYLPSLLAAAAGCVIADRRRERRGELPLTASWPPRARWLAAALVAVAGFARVWGFPDWPPSHGVGFEEEELGGAAIRLLEERWHPSEHRLPTYAAALGFVLFGPSLTSLRVVFVAMSALAPLLFLGACRRLARPPVALLCTALYGFSWWATAAGRFADEIHFVAPLTAAVVWLLLVVLDEKSTLAALGLGLLSGALLFEYTAYRLVPLLVTGHLLLKLAARGWRALRTGPAPSWRSLAASFRPLLALAAVFAIGLSVSTLPAAIAFLYRHGFSPLEGFARHAEVPGATIRKASGELAHLVFARSANLARALVVPDQGEPIVWMNSEPCRPSLGPFAGAVLGAGCLLALLNLRRRLHALLAVWIAVSAGTALVVPLNENTMRYFTIFPVAWLLAASGLERAWPGRDRRRAAQTLAVGAAALAAGVAVSDAAFLHLVLANDPAVSESFVNPCITTARVIGALPPGSRVILCSEVCNHIGHHPDTRWLLAGREVVAVESQAEALQPRQTEPGPDFLVTASTITQPGLGRLLTETLPSSCLEPPDPWPHGNLDLVVLRMGCEKRSDDHPRESSERGEFTVQSFEGPPGEPSGPGRPPAGSTLFETHREPFLTSLGQRRSTLLHAESLRESPHSVYWVAWTGFATPPVGCRGVRLRLRSGYGWLWLDGTLVLRGSYQGPEVVVKEQAMQFRPGQIVSVEACSYHIGNDPPALQVEWLDDGLGTVLSGTGRPSLVD